MADDGEVAWDGETTGELEVRGPWVASRYYNDSSGDDKFDDGWLRTGDIATIDAEGYMRITDRTKDLIKSGGEWISSVELENELMAHPDVAEAAVIARPDERWAERPLACVVLEEGAGSARRSCASTFLDRVAKWWLPERGRVHRRGARRRASASSTRRSCASASRRASWRPRSWRPAPEGRPQVLGEQGVAGQDSPEDAGRAVAEHRTRLGGEDGSHPPAVAGQPSMPHGVDPAVDRVQSPLLESLVDLARADIPDQQLPAADGCRAGAREVGNHPVGRLKPNFASHTVVDFGLNAHRSRMPGEACAGTRRGSQACGDREQ